MTHIVHGDRIGKEAQLRVGCAAVIFDAARERILLTQRSDNGQWCLPGGGMEPGESAAETCLRELWEETGLTGQIVRLIGIYSSPHRITVYRDGNRVQFMSLLFEVTAVAGVLQLSDETTAFGYFTPAEIAGLDLLDPHRERVADAFAAQAEPFLR